jgi:O-antigen ligase
MPIEVIILAGLPWLLLVFYAFYHQRSAVLLIWLLIAPAVTYLVDRTEPTVLAETEGTEMDPSESQFYYEQPTKITLQKLLDPNRIVFGAFLLIFLMEGLVKRQHSISLDGTEIWIGIFSVILLANVLLWSGRLAFGLRIAADSYIVPFFSYCVARRLVTTEDRFRQLTRVIGYMAAYVILFCLFERVTTPGLFYRLHGPFEDGGSSVYVVLTVAFFMALLESRYDRRLGMKRGILPPIIRSLVLYLTPVMVAFTLVRANWVGFLLGVGMFLLLGRRLASFSRRTAGTVGLSLLLISIGALLLPLVVPEEFFEERVGDSINIFGRFATWIATLEIVSKAPILGVGLNNLQGLLALQIFSFRGFWNYSTPHNSFLSMIAELGIVGLVAYLAVVVAIIKMGLRLYRTGPRLQDRWRGVALLAVIIAYLTPSMFAHNMSYTGLIHIYVYIFAGALAGIYGRNQLPAISHGYIRRHRSVNQNYPVAAVR